MNAAHERENSHGQVSNCSMVLSMKTHGISLKLATACVKEFTHSRNAASWQEMPTCNHQSAAKSNTKVTSRDGKKLYASKSKWCAQDQILQQPGVQSLSGMLITLTDRLADANQVFAQTAESGLAGFGPRLCSPISL